MNERDTNRTRSTPAGDGPIGLGKKIGLYGCGGLLLMLAIIAALIYLTGVYVPFEGTEGVGP